MAEDPDDARLSKLAELLEAALELVAGRDASERLPEISRLCREASKLAVG